MSALERAAVQRVVDLARDAGVEVPRAVSSLLIHADATYPASVFAARFPEGEDPVRHGCPVEATVCCDSASYNGLRACTCPGRGEPFWCHDGIRRPVAWRHPNLPGVVIPGSPSDYQPPMIGGVPFRADGRPAALCAGWVARAAAISAESPPLPT